MNNTTACRYASSLASERLKRRRRCVRDCRQERPNDRRLVSWHLGVLDSIREIRVWKHIAHYEQAIIIVARAITRVRQGDEASAARPCRIRWLIGCPTYDNGVISVRVYGHLLIIKTRSRLLRVELVCAHRPVAELT